MELSKLLTQPHLLTMAASERLESSYIWAVTFTGLSVVFLALILLVLFLYIFGAIMHKDNQKSKSDSEKKDSVQTQTAPKVPATPMSAASDEDDIVAAITAAIAVISEADGKDYSIRSIRPAKQTNASARSAWAMAGLRDNTTPF